jgi:uncharacterized protein
MTASQGDVFADTSFWIALVVRQDQHHQRAQRWVSRISGQILTTAVVLEAANALARPAWRPNIVALIDHLNDRDDVRIRPLDADLFDRAWSLYRTRMDKEWSLTDCISFEVMSDAGLSQALTADRHFEQAGFLALLTSDPP